jgi:putative membrane protein
MIKYNPKDWFGLIFEFHKSDTLRKLIYVIIIYALFTAVVVYIELNFLHFETTTTIHSLVGFIIGLLLVFRTNTAYDRWWEGRKLLGSLVNTSRNLAIKIHSLIDKQDLQKRNFYSKMITNYCYSLKEHLRDNRDLNEIQSIDSFQKNNYEEINHFPNTIMKEIFIKNKELLDKKVISGEVFITIDNETKIFTEIIGACERIKKTPIPYSYNIFIKKFIFVYTLTLPFGLTSTMFYYWTVPICVFILYILASLELLAEEIENPFGKDPNDLPVDDICDHIKENVEEILISNT